jgi:hypothetical protein
MAERTKKILVKHGSDRRKKKSKREPRKSNKIERDRRKEGSRKITKIGKGKPIRKKSIIIDIVHRKITEIQRKIIDIIYAKW